MRFERFGCYLCLFSMLGLALVNSGQESQIGDGIGGTSVEDVRLKLEDPQFDREKALMEAASLGDLPTVLLLLENNVYPLSTIDETERTPLHEAAASGRADVVQALIRAADEAGLLRETIHAMDSEYRTPLYDAALQGNIDVVRSILDGGALIDSGGLDGLRALHLAVIGGNEELVDFLLSRGAFVLARDAEGWTAKEYAEALHHDRIAQKLDLEARNYWRKPEVQEISSRVKSYLGALRAGDLAEASRLSTPRHRDSLGTELEPVSFQLVIEDIEIHENEARAIIRIVKPTDDIPLFAFIELYRSEEGWQVSRTTYHFAYRWEDIR